MHKAQAQVTDFHRACGLKSGEGVRELPTPPSQWDPAQVQLRLGLIAEEANEIMEGASKGDIVAVVDGLCDLLYVTYGFAVGFGIDLESFFDEVHRTNMLKCSGPKREDGKQLKPEGWQPPRIAAMLDSMYTYFYPDGPPEQQEGDNEDSPDSTDLKSRVLSVVKDTSGPSSFVQGSDVHQILQGTEGAGGLSDS